MSEDQKKELQKQLWNVAKELRGKMNADEFRDYILGFIFYKYLSEKIEIYADSLLKPDGLKYGELNENQDSAEEYVAAIKEQAVNDLGYFLRPNELFHHVAVHGAVESDNLIENLEKILNSIEHSTMGADSEDDFDKLFSELDLNASKLGRTVADRGKLIAKVLTHLDKIDFRLEDSKVDILGDAYEYMIGQFAAGAGKKAGEYYTPQEVSEVLARIVTDGKKRLKTVYDPTCGSGSLLLRLGRHTQIGQYFGQELNNTTYNLARMNMILHDVRFDRFDIKQEDTLEHPQHAEYRFEAVVANPPFSANWSADPLHLQDDRFSQYGKLAPKSKADYAFIQHMVYQLDENGTMAVVMPHGVLFRGAAEGHIREFLIREKNFLDAVIGLPPNLFFGTSIPACILVFKKCRENPDDILFIDASKHFEKGKNQNYLREQDIDKIVETYQQRKAEDKYSYVAKLSEVKENDYNLNIPRYVDTFEEEEPIDLDEVTSEIKKIDSDMSDIDKKIADYCKELGIEAPF
ncbi:MAG: type I restriction-modification system subunit M [Candidatus Saccharibacteria bacterium]|nr:type I restriction-modification system subunit M [Candidatus Saccharibacteria bacterium]